MPTVQQGDTPSAKGDTPDKLAERASFLRMMRILRLVKLIRLVRASREHNREHPCVFGTYQAYLRGCHDKQREDVERARRDGWPFGAQLVRLACCSRPAVFGV